MNFMFDIRDIFPSEINLITADPVCQAFVIHEIDSNSKTVDFVNENWTHKHLYAAHKRTPEWKMKQKQLDDVIDRLGNCSASAQNLQVPITTSPNLKSSNQRVYIMQAMLNDVNLIVGFVRIGHKKLFLFDENERQIEKNALCLMDFYIVETLQRKGYGLRLLKKVLQIEDFEAHQLAYDVPSEKMKHFLDKHFGLKNSIPQSVHFTIFHGFFIENEDENHSPVFYQQIHDERKLQNSVYSQHVLENYLQRKIKPPSFTAASCLIWNDTNACSPEISKYKIEEISANKDEQRNATSDVQDLEFECKCNDMKDSTSWNILGVKPRVYH